MKIRQSQDFSCDASRLFYKITDFDRWIASGQRSGFETERTDKKGPVQIGSGWITRGRWRGRERVAEITMTGFQTPNLLEFETDVEGFEVFTRIDIEHLRIGQCRLHLSMEIKPRGLKARMISPTLRLAQGRIKKRVSRGLRRQAFKIAHPN